MKYQSKTFRLNEKTIENLAKIKKQKGLSYNLLFWDFIKQHSNKSIKKNMKVVVKEHDKCPHCDIGIMKLKYSKYGEFLGCDQFPHCAFTQPIKKPLDIGMAGYKDKPL